MEKLLQFQVNYFLMLKIKFLIDEHNIIAERLKKEYYENR